MSDIDQNLYEFLMKNSKDENAVRDKLRNEGLNFRFDKLKENANYENTIKLRYMLINYELKNIKQKFEQKGITFVVLKGISLAQRLYKNPCNRYFGDIDLLVASKDLYKATKIMEILGYRTEGETDEESLNYYLQQMYRELHLMPFYKKVAGSVEIIIELHMDIVSLWMFRIDTQLTECILDRRKIENDIPVMDEYDTIIFQILHLFKHYIAEMTAGFVNGVIENKVSLKGLHEIALLVDKYIDILDEKQFSDRVVEFRATEEVRLIKAWLLKVYPDLGKIKNLSVHDKKADCIADHFCGAIRNVDIKRLLLDDSQKVASEIIFFLQKGAPSLKCYKSDVRITPKEQAESCGYLDGDRGKTGSPFGTRKVYGTIGKEVDYTAKFWFTWDNTYLWFHVIVKHFNPVFHQYINDDLMISDNSQEFVRLFFDTANRKQGEPYVCALIIKPKYNSEGKIDIYVHKNINGNLGKEIVHRTEYVSKIDISDEGYFLQIGLKWDIIPLIPKIGIEIILDVLVSTEELEITWQNASYNGWYNIGEYGKIVLQE